MDLAGEIVMRIACNGAGVSAVRCESSRPRIAEALLPGLAPSAAAATVGRVFAICGRAQSMACACAAEAAGGAPAAAAAARSRDAALALEMALEHLWHFLMDLPRHAGAAPRARAMGEARRRADAGAIAAVAAAEVFGMPHRDWARMTRCTELGFWSRWASTFAAGRLAQLLAAEPALGACAVGLLPPITADGLRAGVLEGLEEDADFAAAPSWSGEARETGALARMARHPVVAQALERWGGGVATRHIARLVELAQVLAELEDEAPRARHGAFAPAADAGLAWAETARGLLLHRARLADGRIAGYRIVAPTEWNFHPQGAFVAGARAIAAREPEAIARQARALAASLDPCVAWRVEVDHA